MRLLVLLVVALVGAGGGTASAATLSLSTDTTPTDSAPFLVTASGSTEEPSSLEVYSQPEGSACGATRAEQQSKPDSKQASANSGSPQPPAGSYSVKFNQQAPTGRYLVCGYLSYNSNPAPSATPAATASLPVEVKADADRDRVADDADACPSEAGQTANGCPPDADGDGVSDVNDGCDDQPGPKPSGCPPRDSDGDGFPDGSDACFDRPGVQNGDPGPGCPALPPCPNTEFSIVNAMPGSKSEGGIVMRLQVPSAGTVQIESGDAGRGFGQPKAAGLVVVRFNLSNETSTLLQSQSVTLTLAATFSVKAPRCIKPDGTVGQRDASGEASTSHLITVTLPSYGTGALSQGGAGSKKQTLASVLSKGKIDTGAAGFPKDGKVICDIVLAATGKQKKMRIGRLVKTVKRATPVNLTVKLIAKGKKALKKAGKKAKLTVKTTLQPKSGGAKPVTTRTLKLAAD